MWNWIERRRESRRLAAKHAAWRAELDRLGVWVVQQRLNQAGAGALKLLPTDLNRGIPKPA